MTHSHCIWTWVIPCWCVLNPNNVRWSWGFRPIKKITGRKTEVSILSFPFSCPVRPAWKKRKPESHKEGLGCQLKQVYLKPSNAAHESAQREVLEKRSRTSIFVSPLSRPESTKTSNKWYGLPNCKTNTPYIYPNKSRVNHWATAPKRQSKAGGWVTWVKL